MSVLSQLAAWPHVPRALMVRHAERHEIRGLQDILTVELTAHGHVQARHFGRELANFGSALVYHSPLLRCEQTATAIALGFADRQVEVKLGGALSFLGGEYIRDPARLYAALTTDRGGFIRNWFEGRLGDSVVAPRSEVVKNHVDGVQRLWQAPTPNTLLVLVTHDWNILALREHVLGLVHEVVGDVGYLEGLAFCQTPEGIVMGIDGVERSLLL